MSGPTGFGPAPGSAEPETRVRRASYLPPGGLGGPGSGLVTDPRRYAVTRSAKPGIIPLHPLGLSDVLDGAVKLVRRNPGAVLGTSAVVNVLANIPAIILTLLSAAGSWMRASGVATVVDARSWASLIGLAGTAYAVLLLGGVLGYAGAEAALGHRPDRATIWAAVRPRAWTLLGSQALVLGVAVVPWLLLIGAVALLSKASVPIILLTGLTLTLVAVGVDLLVAPRLLLAAPAVVLEGLGVRASFRRSWALVRGRWWSVAGTFLLTLAVTVLVFWVLQLPQWAAYTLLVGLFEPSRAVADVASNVGFSLATLGAAVLVTPMLAGTTVLRYLDARMRAEGFDLVLLRAVAAEGRVGS